MQHVKARVEPQTLGATSERGRVEIPDGIWRCENGHEWSHKPGLTECPECGAFERITWVNWPEVEAAVLAKQGYWHGGKARWLRAS